VTAIGAGKPRNFKADCPFATERDDALRPRLGTIAPADRRRRERVGAARRWK
jgi:hypothetical protein